MKTLIFTMHGQLGFENAKIQVQLSPPARVIQNRPYLIGGRR